MSTNLSIESPDFDKIQQESGLITRNAIHLLWEVLNYEIAKRRVGVRRATDYLSGRITSDASTSGENNLDLEGSMVWWYNSAFSFNVSGFRNGIEGRIIFIHNVGAGTITFLHESGSSDAANRLLNNGAASVTMATNQSVLYIYMNSRWREFSAA